MAIVCYNFHFPYKEVKKMKMRELQECIAWINWIKEVEAEAYKDAK